MARRQSRRAARSSSLTHRSARRFGKIACPATQHPAPQFTQARHRNARNAIVRIDGNPPHSITQSILDSTKTIMWPAPHAIRPATFANPLATDVMSIRRLKFAPSICVKAYAISPIACRVTGALMVAKRMVAKRMAENETVENAEAGTMTEPRGGQNWRRVIWRSGRSASVGAPSGGNLSACPSWAPV